MTPKSEIGPDQEMDELLRLVADVSYSLQHPGQSLQKRSDRWVDCETKDMALFWLQPSET